MMRILCVLTLCCCANIRVGADGDTRVRSIGDVKVETHRCAEREVGPRPDVPAPEVPDGIPQTERTCMSVESASGVGVMFQRVVEGVLIARIVAYFLAR